MSESKKQQIIRDIYFDRSGYGSRKTTLEDAKKKEPTIKKEDVEQFFRKNVEIKAKPRGHNSFVAPHNNHTYQIDLFFMGYYDFDEEQKYRGGLVCIDVLSKYAVVIPIVSKNEPDVIEATKEALKKMGKKPKIIYSDDEKAIAGGDFKDILKVKVLSCIGQGVILLLLKDLYAPTKICFLKKLKQMKRKEENISNGLITI